MYDMVAFVLLVVVLLLLAVLLPLKGRRDAALRMCVANADLNGQICVVTGASAGLGMEISRQLALRNATVVLGCRDLKKAAKAVTEILEVATMPVTALKLDLDDLDSIDNFVISLRKKYDKVDILVNNAGVMGFPFTMTNCGIEQHFSTNHLGHFYLTNLLLDRLRLSSSARVLIISSGYYAKIATADFDYVTSRIRPPDYNTSVMYARSKLANCLHARELARRLESTNISVYAIQPGFVRGTELGRNFNRFLLFIAWPLIWYFSRSLLQGVQTMLHCCLSPRTTLQSGRLYANCEMVEYTPTADNPQNAQKLFQYSSALIQRIKTQVHLKKEQL